tara:strand:+ start:2337 stop:2933 length:597 start_codon:yes stop_codon:yes gene_type:complete
MAQNAKIKVVPDELGNIIRVSKNNPKWGFIRVQQELGMWNKQGFFDHKTRSYLMKGEIEKLQPLGITADTTFEGNLVRIESFEPFRNTEPERDLKIAGDTGVICKGVDPDTGEIRDIYHTMEYDASGTVKDQLIPHVNGQEIRDAQGNTTTTDKVVKPVKKKLTQEDLQNVIDKKKEEVVEEEQKEEEVVMEDETFEL